METGGRLVTIASVYSRPELYALLALLRTNGIFAATAGEGHARVDWTLLVALGGVRVQVREEDVTLARELLAQVAPQPYRGPVFAPDRAVDIALMVLMTFIFWVPPPSRIPAVFYFEEGVPGDG